MRGAMYNCPNCLENFNSVHVGIKHCPFCGSKYKDVYNIHIEFNKKYDTAQSGRIGSTLANRLWERYKCYDFETEATMEPHRVILILKPLQEPSITPIEASPNPVQVSTHPEIAKQLAESRRMDIEAMRDR